MTTTSSQPVIVGITGATGCILGFRLVKALLQLDQPVELIISTHAVQVILEEMNLTLPASGAEEETILRYLELSEQTHQNNLRCFSNKQIGASPASGTHLTQGMVIMPCSMATLGKLASGVTDNLVTRAADVTLKERRKLIVVPRESPFNRIHLENMLRLEQAGAVILPPVLSFYQPAFQSLDGQIDYTVGKALDHLGIVNHGLYPRWSG